MTVKRRSRGTGKSHRGDDALTLEEWKRRKSEERLKVPDTSKPPAARQTRIDRDEKGRPK